MIHSLLGGKGIAAAIVTPLALWGSCVGQRSATKVEITRPAPEAAPDGYEHFDQFRGQLPPLGPRALLSWGMVLPASAERGKNPPKRLSLTFPGAGNYAHVSEAQFSPHLGRSVNRLSIVNAEQASMRFPTLNGSLLAFLEIQHSDGKWTVFQRTTPICGPKGPIDGLVELGAGKYWDIPIPATYGPNLVNFRVKVMTSEGNYLTSNPFVGAVRIRP